MQEKTWVEISGKAMRSNIAELKMIVGENISILVVVKGNAYGAGIEHTVQATKKMVDWYGVDTLDEANTVRKYCEIPILIMGYVAPVDFAEVINKKFSIVVSKLEDVLLLSSFASLENPAKIHIKVDMGLVRLGLFPDEAIKFAEKIVSLPNIIVEGVCTHFVKLVDDNNTILTEALKQFVFVVDALCNLGIKPKLLHTASSMGAIICKELRFNMVRVGIIVYGFWGRESGVKLIREKKINFNPHSSIAWKTTIVNIKEIPKNTGVGYNHSEIVDRKTTVAVLGVGYYDGLDKRYGKIGYVLINGKRAKILGGISMNMCMVDITDIDSVKIGDIAVLLGCSGDEEITPYEFAGVLNTSTYELISRINPLLKRILVD